MKFFRRVAIAALGALPFVVTPMPSHADTNEYVAASQHWISNGRAALDVSSRRVDSLGDDSWSGNYVVGLDFRTVFTGRSRDAATLVFQPYLVRLANATRPTPVVDDPADWELTWRIANLNAHILERGRMNVRLGHFEVPFGLEQNIDTNGTLRQLTFSERGIKADWGVSVNGLMGALEYEAALTRGSGNDYETYDGSHLYAGRVGTLSYRNLVVGLSFMDGRILGIDRATRRQRLGLDVAYYRGAYEWLFEWSEGEDSGAPRRSLFGELSWRSPLQRLHLYGQLNHRRGATAAGETTHRSATVGIWLTPWRHLDVSSELARRLDDDAPDSATLSLQVRYRWEER